MLCQGANSKLRPLSADPCYFAGNGRLLLLASLDNQGLVNVRNDTTTSNRGLDESIQLLVTTNGQLHQRMFAFGKTNKQAQKQSLDRNRETAERMTCKCRGVIRFIRRSREAFPANSSTCTSRKNFVVTLRGATERTAKRTMIAKTRRTHLGSQVL